MKLNQREKKSFLINPRFQWTVIGYVSFLAILVLGVVFALVHFSFEQFAILGAEAQLPEGHIYFQFVETQRQSFFRVLFTIAILTLMILIAGGVYLSHRVAGPIYRVVSYLRRGETQKEKLKFRKNDFFPELADAINDWHQRNEKK